MNLQVDVSSLSKSYTNSLTFSYTESWSHWRALLHDWAVRPVRACCYSWAALYLIDSKTLYSSSGKTISRSCAVQSIRLSRIWFSWQRRKKRFSFLFPLLPLYKHWAGGGLNLPASSWMRGGDGLLIRIFGRVYLQVASMLGSVITCGEIPRL